MRAARLWGRLAARLGSVGAALAIVVLVGAQFFHALDMNLDLQRRLSAAHAEREQLTTENAALRAKIRRLQTPEGSVPAIHDELHLVRPHEEIIYLEGNAPAGR
ncbi:MAG: hypothetical protein KGM44_07885 [bacterium]|nr:hypothetical protein [bacterium]